MTSLSKSLNNLLTWVSWLLFLAIEGSKMVQRSSGNIFNSRKLKMGLSTHVLDTMHGKPAAGMAVALLKKQGEGFHLVKSLVLNQDGRADSPLIDTQDLQVGQYRLSFSAGEYFRSKVKDLVEPMFLDVVHLDFGVSNPKEHYHVPLLVSPWSYSTYRGS